MTEPPPLPSSVTAFLDAEVFSIPQLEVLLLVHGSENPRTLEQVAQDFYLPAGVIGPWLDDLVARGLLRSTDGGYAALADEASRSSEIDEVAECYAKRRVTVARHVYASNQDPVRRFADAFRLRKDKKP